MATRYLLRKISALSLPLLISLFSVFILLRLALHPTYVLGASPSEKILVTEFQDELNDDEDCSLREAILAANLDKPVSGCPAGEDDDLIVLPTGIYRLSIPGEGEDLNETGDADIFNDPLIIQGEEADFTIIDASGLDRVLQIHAVAVRLEGLTLTGGHTPDYGDNHGGGIYITTGGSLELVNSSIQENRTGPSYNGAHGAGIYNLGSLKILNSQIRHNTASEGEFGGKGGAIFTDGPLTLDHTLLIGNQAGPGASGTIGGSGGGIFITSNSHVTLTYSTLSGNQAGFGGDGYINGFGGSGGGIINYGLLTVNNSSVVDNRAGDGFGSYGTGGSGGGISNHSWITITNTTISGNRSGQGQGSSGSGGGLNHSYGFLWLLDSTIVSNTVYGNGGGITINSGATFSMKNTLLAGNHDAGEETPDCVGAFSSLDYNIIGQSTGCSFTPLPHDQVGNSTNPIDPRLSPLITNSSLTPFHLPLPGSPLLDAGICAEFSQDQLGNFRGLDLLFIPNVTSGCDSGAIELQGLVFLPLVRK